MKLITPYVGICDFMNREQVLDMLNVIRNYKHAGIKLMVGTMTSYKVLHDLPTSWANVFPKAKDLEEIFSISDPLIVNTIHYADYEPNHQNLADWLCELMDLCGNYLDAIQLDMVWPDPKQLELFQSKFPMPIVLQINKQSMKDCENNPKIVAQKIRDEYRDSISCILLDCSMGKGIPIDVALMENYIEAIRNYTAEIEIAVGGGLGPDTVSSVSELIKNYRVSIDAQSKLRVSGDAHDPINWDLAKKYLHKSAGYYL